MRHWIAKRLGINTLMRDEWTLSERIATSSEKRRLWLRRWMVRVYFAAKEMLLAPVSIPRALWHLILMLRELERLHFGPMRKVSRSRGCVVDRQTWIVNGQNLFLGRNVKISAYSTVMAGNVAKITIGDNTIIGPGVVIVAFNHGTSDRELPIRFQPWKDTVSHSVEIGSNVWIGAGAMVLPGSRIHKNSIVGAGTLVKGVIPEGAVVTGARENVRVKVR